MDGLELLESLNPIPEHRGNPGPLPESDPSSTRRFASLAGVLAVAAVVIGLGAFFLRADPAPVDVEVGEVAELATQPSDDASDAASMPESTPIPSVHPLEVGSRFADEATWDIDGIARLVVPLIDVDQIVGQGVGIEALRKGPGHYPDTSLPGQPGNAAIAGHRTTYGAPFFRLDELAVGDEIYVSTAQGTFEYRVQSSSITTPDDVGVLDDFGDNRLTLTAAHPPYQYAERIVVVAQLVGEPAPPTVADPSNSVTATAPPTGELAASGIGNAPDLEGVFGGTNLRYLGFVGTSDPVETARQFLQTEFPGWGSSVDVALFETNDQGASLRWIDEQNSTAGWIVLEVVDTRYHVWKLTTNGVIADLTLSAAGVSGWVQVDRPVVVDLYAATKPGAINEGRDTSLYSLDMTSEEVSEDGSGILVAAADQPFFRAATLVVRNAEGTQIAAVLEPLPIVSRPNNLLVITEGARTEVVVDLLAENRSVVGDVATYDVWQSADLLAAFGQASGEIADLPTLQLTTVEMGALSRNLPPLSQTNLFGLLIELGDVLPMPTESFDGEAFELGPPAMSYVVEKLPDAARCWPLTTPGSLPLVTQVDVRDVFATPRDAIDSEPWRVTSDTVEFVTADGVTLGFGSVLPDRPRTFLSVIAVANTAEGWHVVRWETAGC